MAAVQAPCSPTVASPLAVVLALAYGAIQISPALAAPGDCTAIEAASYFISPMKYNDNSTATVQAECVPNGCYAACPQIYNPSGWSRGFSDECWEACSSVPVPHATGSTRKSPGQQAARATCHTAPCHAVHGVQDSNCHANLSVGSYCHANLSGPCKFQVTAGDYGLDWAGGYLEPDPTRIATKAAAMAASSPKCAACTARFAPGSGSNGASEASCVLKSGYDGFSTWNNEARRCHYDWYNLVGQCVSENAGTTLLSEHKYADYAALTAYMMTAQETTDPPNTACLGWSSLEQCQVHMLASPRFSCGLRCFLCMLSMSAQWARSLGLVTVVRQRTSASGMALNLRAAAVPSNLRFST
jgi:hypothetical protein